MQRILVTGIGFGGFAHKRDQKHLKIDLWRFGLAWFGLVMHQLWSWINPSTSETKKIFKMYKT